jgi:ABC-2 type transport system permease protein
MPEPGPRFPVRAFFVRDFLQAVSYKTAFLMDAGGTFFTVLIWYGISRFVEPSALSGDPDGPLSRPGGYFLYSIGGLAPLHFLYASLRTFSEKIRREQMMGTFEAILVTPASLPAVALASSVWEFAMAGARYFWYLFFAWLLAGTIVHPGSLPAFLLALLVTVLCASGVGLLAAAVIVVVKQGNPVTAAAMGITFLLGGVVFPAELLPGPLATLARLLPPHYAIRSLRETFFYGAGFPEVAADLAVVAGYALVLLPAGLLAFHAAVRRARRDGTLVQY